MTLSLGPTQFAFLPAPSSTIKGTIAAVSDSAVKGVGRIISGGGTFKVMAFCDGANWTVAPGNDFWFSIVVDRINMLRLQPHIDYSTWTFSHATVTNASSVAVPDGNPCLQKLICDNTTNIHQATSPVIDRQGGPTTPGTFSRAAPFRFSVFVRADGITTCQLAISDGGSNGVSAAFDLNSGLIVTPATAFGSGFTAVSQGITPFGGGWYRCYVDALGGPDGNLLINFSLAARIMLGTGSFAGDGVSGIDLWRASLVPIHAYDLTRRVFFDDFISASTIDLTNSKAPAFNWYLNNNWPFGYSPWQGCSATQAGDISVANSIMSISTDRSGFGQAVNTIVDNGAGGYIGQTWQVPAMFECSMGWASAIVLGTENNGQVPAFWTIAGEFLISNQPSAPNLPFVEWDITLAFPGTAHLTGPDGDVMDYRPLGGPGSGFSHNIAGNLLNQRLPSPNINWGRFNRFSSIWITVAQNAQSGGAYGQVMSFVNGVYSGEVLYNASSTCSPTTAPVNISGACFPGESNHFPIILGAGITSISNNGGQWPAWFDYVAVYQ
jgi:hypothetical protein